MSGAGVYVGTALSNRSISGNILPINLENSSYLSIDDTFPDYSLLEHKTEVATTISEVVSQGPTLFIFVSSTCGACNTMAVILKNKVVTDLRQEIQIALIYNQDELESLDQSGGLLDVPGAKIFGTNRYEQFDQDGMFATPTLVALNKERKVSFIMTGYSRRIDAEFINENI